MSVSAPLRRHRLARAASVNLAAGNQEILSMHPPPLAGLRVVEFSAFVAAPLAGLTLAQMGAEVIRVDPIGGNIDTSRLPLNAEGRSLYWASLNRGKRSVELDLRGAPGRALLQDLICAPGDGPPLFLTNLAVNGVLSYEALSGRRPDLIMLQLTGSPDGSSALDYTVNCAVGLPDITGDARSAPVNHVLPAWDIAAGLTLASAALAAERQWRASGRGQHVRLALSDVAMAALCNLGYIADAQVNGTERKPDGNFLYGAYGDAFATRDARRVMLVAITQRQWEALVRATGIEAALAQAADSMGHRLDTEAGRYEARDLISAFLRPWFARRTLDELKSALVDRSIIWGPYRSVQQMLREDPRCSEANAMFALLDHPGVGRFLTSGSPIRFGDAQAVTPGLAPALGQHTSAVLRQRLGWDEAQVRDAAERGLIPSPSGRAAAQGHIPSPSGRGFG
jgi:2-methylfumaryl-CoA isomerase